MEWRARSVTVEVRRMPFRVWPGPAGPDTPMILFLHGRGESGTDNARQVEVGLPRFVSADPNGWPFRVVAPQKPDADRLWPEHAAELAAVLAAVDEELPGDPDRRYLSGLSQGGNGTLVLAAHLPWRFAAIAPVCGWADPMRAVRELRSVPVWAFHGEADPIVPASCSLAVVESMRNFGGTPRLTVYPGVGHNAWDRAYGEDGPALAEWLLAQRLPAAVA
jgi:predicted peptidase